jgi:hypothetical protein
MYIPIGHMSRPLGSYVGTRTCVIVSVESHATGGGDEKALEREEAVGVNNTELPCLGDEVGGGEKHVVDGDKDRMCYAGSA